MPRGRLVQLLLALLWTWAIGFELRRTLLPALPEVPFGKASSDVALLLAAGLCVAAARRHDGTERRAWLLIGVGLALWTAGDAWWTFVLYDLERIPIPSPADAGYLAFIPCVFGGLILLAHARLSHAATTLWLDGLIAALAAAAVSAGAVLNGIAAEASGGLAEVATNLAYPIGDLALLALIVGAIALRGWRIDRTWSLLGAAILVFWASDSLYLVTNANGTYSAGSWFDVGWSLAGILFATAAWTPPPTHRLGADERTSTIRASVIPTVFALVSLALLVGDGWSESGRVTDLLAGASLLAALARLLVANHLNRALLTASRLEATTDALTHLGNRRALAADLDLAAARATADAPALLAVFDLDGFKHYNDSFGHPAGDALLIRLAHALRDAVSGVGQAYRMGGDEFCVLLEAPLERALAGVEKASLALAEKGEGFVITASHGVVMLPMETTSAAEALGVADQRMYAHKDGGRACASRQSTDVLLRALAERHADLGAHTAGVADLAQAVAHRLGLRPFEVDDVRRAAELHDIGKVAIPDSILTKPAPLDEHEWRFMRSHVLIGERIVAAAPALSGVAKLIRASHERWDGTGYPDHVAGDDIPFGARIVAVCDAYDAMTGDRPYRTAMAPKPAVAELQAQAGSQFDPTVVKAFIQTLSERRTAALDSLVA